MLRILKIGLTLALLAVSVNLASCGANAKPRPPAATAASSADS